MTTETIHVERRAVPEAENAEDELVLLLLGDRALRYWTRLGKYDWRAAHIASWSVPVACCVRCKGTMIGCAGLSERGTIHRQCFPEAWS